MIEVVDETKIRAAIARLDFKAPIQAGREFVDLNPVLPPSFAVLEHYDIDNPLPPEGLSQADYDAMRPDFVVMRAAISEHDHNMLEESTELFRERFWTSWGEPDLLGGQLMRRRYLSRLADRLITIAKEDGPKAIAWIGWVRWSPIILGV